MDIKKNYLHSKDRSKVFIKKNERRKQQFIKMKIL